MIIIPKGEVTHLCWHLCATNVTQATIQPWVARVPFVVFTCFLKEADDMQTRVQGQQKTMNARLKRLKVLGELYVMTQHNMDMF